MLQISDTSWQAQQARYTTQSDSISSQLDQFNFSEELGVARIWLQWRQLQLHFPVEQKFAILMSPFSDQPIICNKKKVTVGHTSLKISEQKTLNLCCTATISNRNQCLQT
jgi:hypothetical protein